MEPCGRKGFSGKWQGISNFFYFSYWKSRVCTVVNSASPAGLVPAQRRCVMPKVTAAAAATTAAGSGGALPTPHLPRPCRR